MGEEKLKLGTSQYYGTCGISVPGYSQDSTSPMQSSWNSALPCAEEVAELDDLPRFLPTGMILLQLLRQVCTCCYRTNQFKH